MIRFRLSCLTLAVLLAACVPLHAQQGLFNHKDDKPKFSTPLPYRLFHLANMTEQSNANEVVQAVRRVIDSDAVTLIGVQNDLLVIGSPEQLNAAADLIKSLDMPRPLYHLSFTVTETDGGHRAVRHYAMYATGGQPTQLRATRWLPLAPPAALPPRTSLPAGKLNAAGGALVEITAEEYDRLFSESRPAATGKAEHIETGMTFDVTLDEYTGGVRLQTKITDSSLPTEPPPPGTTNPIIEQNELTDTSLLRWGKPILLGVIDPPGTTRHIEIEVVADQQ